jgi:voltage-gated sodium channel
MLREGNKLESFLNSDKAHNFLAILLVFNAILLGVETSQTLMAQYGPYVKNLDTLILQVFIWEIALRIFAGGFRFFKCSWNIFDVFVIGTSCLVGNTAISALRALRLLRIISLFPRMRFLVSSLGQALPGIFSVAVILVSMFYIASVVACQSFGGDNPLFASLTGSMYTLFQLMLADDFSAVTRKVLETHPHAYMFFIPFIVVMTFTVLNLFFGLIVNSMQNAAEEENTKALAEHAGVEHEPDMTQNKLLMNELRDLKKEISSLKKALAKKGE